MITCLMPAVNVSECRHNSFAKAVRVCLKPLRECLIGILFCSLVLSGVLGVGVKGEN